jgi:transcription antitermination factor NusG
MGFVGSTGKGALPIPVSIYEYEDIEDTQVNDGPHTITKTSGTKFKPGMNVVVKDGSFKNEKANIKSINHETGIVTLAIELFNKINEVELPIEFISIE